MYYTLRLIRRRRTTTGRPDSRRCLCVSKGQVMLEFAMALVGFAVFLTVLLRTWVWLNTMILGRQAAFQRTREEAGSSHPGVHVSYARPPITLLGDPGSPGTGSTGFPVDPSCTAGEPYLQQAKQRLGESQDFIDQADCWFIEEEQRNGPPKINACTGRQDPHYPGGVNTVNYAFEKFNHCGSKHCRKSWGGEVQRRMNWAAEARKNAAWLSIQACVKQSQATNLNQQAATACGETPPPVLAEVDCNNFFPPGEVAAGQPPQCNPATHQRPKGSRVIRVVNGQIRNECL